MPMGGKRAFKRHRFRCFRRGASFSDFAIHCQEGNAMHAFTNLSPLVSLIAGILILVVPRLLNYIVAIYLIVIGLLGLFGGHFH
ncbi:hypothetical protein Bcep18194_C6798 [Burkholderia lata]|uniref:DUF3096 domain-containing protein n=1 Tax=Burkholderia lata (strain ATCC 17760 / DSM 23089 / LMG 22485 / NCIMB 9086 / R18194 / 383) TaxID=482957 RepID=Q39NX1_BURL3|nr:hypothetical protein Bcep18194_C6798 [Burkholderia lata]